MQSQDINSLDGTIHTANWPEALKILLGMETTRALSFSEQKMLAMIYFNLHQYDKGFTYLQQVVWGNYSDCTWLRRMVIAPLIKAKNFIWAVHVLELIIKHHPSSLLDLRTLSSVLIRQNKRAEGCVYLEQVRRLVPEDYELVAQLIQLKFQDNKQEEALTLAQQYEYAYASSERLLKIALKTLSKSKKIETCIQIITALDFSKVALDVGLLSAQIAFEGKCHRLAQTICNQLLTLGHQDAYLYLISAKTLLASGGDDLTAISFLKKAYEIDKDHIQVNSVLGDLLFNKGLYAQSLPYLDKLKAILPSNAHTRLLLARALKFTGQYEKAADEMLALGKLQPDSLKLKRYTASALAQAGRHDEAKHHFEKSISIRAKTLAPTFEAGLTNFDHQLESLKLPKARFDWLWNIITSHGTIDPIQQTIIEKSIKWVNLLDHFLIDWLECMPDKADEAMVLFEDLSDIYTTLHDTLNSGKGVILSGAHVGPMFAIPLALELIGLPHKWLASTPSISSLAYRQTLISTSENTETQVVRRILKSLSKGEITALAVDGAMSPSAPKRVFENQKVTYSDFAAKISYRTQAPSFFISSLWKQNRFYLQLEALPQPMEEETMDAFCSRWTNCFFVCLRKYLTDNPSNARLSGGFWRHIH
ncbi:MAG: hypothetical protein H0U75_09515 [Legionella sp.]|nr:hypothetical protein [Legionella sp.]